MVSWIRLPSDPEVGFLETRRECSAMGLEVDHGPDPGTGRNTAR
jgi:hypothetical protein